MIHHFNDICLLAAQGTKKKRTGILYRVFAVQNSGFTLLELIIVLIVIGIASGIAGIYISKGRGGLEVKTFTKEISAALRYARNQAVTEKKIYCFVINRDEGKYRLYAESTDYKQVDMVMDKVIPEELKMVLQDNDSDSEVIEFFPRGNSTGGTLEISGEKGTTYFITINMVTGKLEVEKAE